MLMKCYTRGVLPLLGLFVAGFAALCVFYVAKYHVSPLSRDQWFHFYYLFHDGLLQAALESHNEQRHIIPFFLFWADMQWFGGHNHLLTAMGFIFNTGIVALLIMALRSDVTLSTTAKWLLALFIIFEFTWLLNDAELGWGFMGSMYYLTILAAMLAVWSVYSAMHGPLVQQRTCLIAAVGYATVATFSFGSGIVVWPVMLILLLEWRASSRVMIVIASVMVLMVALFMLLPSGQAVRDTLTFVPQHTVVFPAKLMGGPVYYLLHSYRGLSETAMRSAALLAGVGITVIGLGLLLHPLLLRLRGDTVVMSRFVALSHALAWFGFGAAVLITLTRGSMFLEPYVDRYQIWATLFWVGIIALLWRWCSRQTSPVWVRMLATVLCVLPLLALPSQLDRGARLSEYRIRVTESLLAFEVGIPSRKDAERALHWNWEGKLPYFFDVMEQIRQQHKNVFADGKSLLMHQRTVEIGNAVVPACKLTVLRSANIPDAELLDMTPYPSTPGRWATPGKGDAGYRLYAKTEEQGWNFAVIMGDKYKVYGLGVRIEQRPLPRGNFLPVNEVYDLYAVLDNIPDKKLKLWLLRDLHERPVCSAPIDNH